MTPEAGMPQANAAPSTQQLAVSLSALTYSSDPQTDIARYLPGWSIVWNGIQTYDGNYAFIALDPTSTIYALAIRGSLPPFDIMDNWAAFANWILEDLSVMTRVSWPYTADPSAGALIAAGTDLAFTQVSQEMIDSLGSGLTAGQYLQQHAAYSGSSRQVLITGHSLGGNIANVFASFFVSQLATYRTDFSNISLVTFAAPAAGNEAFAADLDAKLPDAWHYENANDIVPKCPVAVTVGLIGLMYTGGPSAMDISCTYDGMSVNLTEAFALFAGVLAFYGYTQQSVNYDLFNVDVYGPYKDDTLYDFFRQAGYQHEVVHYADNLGVTLPRALAEESRLV